MSTNFRRYGDVNNNRPMNVADLEVGQTIVRIFTPNNSWGVITGEFRTVNYTVKKVLKTRLVLEDAEGRELRMMLETSKYSTWRQGEVQTDREGDSQSYRRDPIQLATEGDPVIEEMRADWAKRIQEQADKNAAKAAVAEVRQALDGTPDLAKVEAAIQALQVIADNLRAQA